jgi:hypothetical protein
MTNNSALVVEPTFDEDGSPSDETLLIIENFSYEEEVNHISWKKFFDFVRICWNIDYGNIRYETDDENNKIICFITGGWSDNEAIQGAINRNFMFKATRWESSHRGGLAKYKINENEV